MLLNVTIVMMSIYVYNNINKKYSVLPTLSILRTFILFWGYQIINKKYFKNLALIFAGWGAFFFTYNFYVKSNNFYFNSYVIKKYATFYI